MRQRGPRRAKAHEGFCRYKHCTECLARRRNLALSEVRRILSASRHPAALQTCARLAEVGRDYRSRSAQVSRSAPPISPLKNGGQTNRTGRRSGAAALAACPPKTLSCHKLRQRNVFGRQNSDPRFERERRFASAHVQKLV